MLRFPVCSHELFLCIKAVPFIIDLLILIAAENLPAFGAEAVAKELLNITESMFRTDFMQLFRIRRAPVPAENASHISTQYFVIEVFHELLLSGFLDAFL
jgi:hypothetical protein